MGNSEGRRRQPAPEASVAAAAAARPLLRLQPPAQLAGPCSVIPAAGAPFGLWSSRARQRPERHRCRGTARKAAAVRGGLAGRAHWCLVGEGTQRRVQHRAAPGAAAAAAAWLAAPAAGRRSSIAPPRGSGAARRSSTAAAAHRDAQVAQQALLLVVLDALLAQLILCSSQQRGKASGEGEARRRRKLGGGSPNASSPAARLPARCPCHPHREACPKSRKWAAGAPAGRGDGTRAPMNLLSSDAIA